MALPPDQLALFVSDVEPAASAPEAAVVPVRPAQRRRPGPATAEPAPGRAANGKREQLELRLAPQRRTPVAIAGGGEGSGHRRAMLTALPGGKGAGGKGAGRPLPSRDEITGALLGALADLVAGRISPTAAGAIRSAAEEALRRLEEAERDPHRTPQFVRAARALEELTSVRAR